MKVWHAYLIGIVLFVAAAFGWVLNIIALTHVTELNGWAIARAIGVVVAPLGAVLGYL